MPCPNGRAPHILTVPGPKRLTLSTVCLSRAGHHRVRTAGSSPEFQVACNRGRGRNTGVTESSVRPHGDGQEVINTCGNESPRACHPNPDGDPYNASTLHLLVGCTRRQVRIPPRTAGKQVTYRRMSKLATPRQRFTLRLVALHNSIRKGERCVALRLLRTLIPGEKMLVPAGMKGTQSQRLS